MQQLTQKPGFDERHEAPVLLSSGIPGIRLGLRDVLKPEIEVIRQITTHGVHEITIVRDHSGRIVKETSVPKSDTAAFFDTRHISGFTFTEVVLKSRIIPTNKAGAKVITYTYLDDTELVKSAIERKYISDESSGNLSSTIETVNTYTPDGQKFISTNKN